VTRLLNDYRFAAYTLLRCCQRNDKRFQGSAIRVQEAPDPTNIIWEYQDVKWWIRRVRQALVLLLFVIIIVLSLGLVYAANVGAKAQAKSSTSFLGELSCDPVDKEQEAEYKCILRNASSWSLEYALSTGGDALDCWCSAQGSFNVVKNPELRVACMDWLIGLAKSAGLMGLSSCMVVIINVIVKAILIALAYFERPLSISALNSSMVSKVFAAQTLNMGFVMVLVNYYAPEAIRTLSSALPFGQLIFRGDYDDFTRGWYSVVGSALLLNLLVNAFTPAAANLGKMASTSLIRRFMRSRVKHQIELLKYYTNPPFDISIRYAQLLTTVFCTMTYSSGLPLLPLFAAFYCFIMYWTDKIVLLWGSERPPAYDTQIPREASQKMLWAIALHCFFAVAMYGQPCTFPSMTVGGTLGELSDQAIAASNGTSTSNSGLFVDWLGERVSRESSWMMFTMLVVLIVMYVVWTLMWILGGTFGEFWMFLVMMCCPRRAKTLPDDAAGHMSWARAAERIEQLYPPASYRLERSPAFEQFSEFMQATGTAQSTSIGTAKVKELNVSEADSEVPVVPETPLQAMSFSGSSQVTLAEAPVPAAIARGFVEALWATYVRREGEAVGMFLSSLEPSQKDILVRYEDNVKASSNPAHVISKLTKSWELQVDADSA